MATGEKQNRLSQEKSPYLLQHANNPVDWYPWGDEAFECATKEDKPIFLSVGYSTCHWCHVMERESFENVSIANVMNRHFVCIKVDREERPDVDKVYMAALQSMGQSGGWPMSMFLTPDLKPFYGGTYYPPEKRYGKIGFPELLERIAHFWLNEREKVVESANGVKQFLLQNRTGFGRVSASPDISIPDLCFNQLKGTYDLTHGGFGSAPKFPRPAVFDFLLRYHFSTKDPSALEMVRHSLKAMAEGGMYDQIGGGFHRYSVDEAWRIPHFEKMLYDQAQLVSVFVDLYRITRDQFAAEVVRDVLDYVMRELTSPEGGFYSAEDADSLNPDSTGEKTEGAFYLWTKAELMKTLGSVEGSIVAARFGIEEDGNALADPHNEFAGKNVLHVQKSIAELSNETGHSESEIEVMLGEGKQKIALVRSRRPRPLLDDKILTSWNGLMISGFARAYQSFGEATYLTAAEKGADFILKHLYDEATGRLMRRFRGGEAKFEASLDDYAFFAQGLLDLYESSFDIRWLRAAMQITQTQVTLFWDSESGGFFDTSGKDKSIIVRMKEHYDGAEPAGNSIAAMNLLRLSYLTQSDDWNRKGKETLKAFAGLMSQQPIMLPQMCSAMLFSESNAKQIVLIGKPEDSEKLSALLRIVRDRYLPNTILMMLESDRLREFADLSPFLASLKEIDGKPTAYICEDFVCQLPTNDITRMAELLDNS